MERKTSDLVNELNRIRILHGYPALNIGGSVSDINISRVEEELKIKFPEDYKNFLREFGSIRFGDSGIYGIIESDPLSLEFQTVLGETVRMREESFMPRGLAVVSGSDYTSFVCLNTDSYQETHKLAYYDSEEKAVFAYTHESTFAEFLSKFLIGTIAVYSEGNKV